LSYRKDRKWIVGSPLGTPIPRIGGIKKSSKPEATISAEYLGMDFVRVLSDDISEGTLVYEHLPTLTRITVRPDTKGSYFVEMQNEGHEPSSLGLHASFDEAIKSIRRQLAPNQ